MAERSRFALVTGANKGIGLEIARQLAQAGVFVIIGARDPGRAHAAVENLASEGLRAHSVLLDLNDYASIVEGAELPVEYALLGEDAVSGRFVEANSATPW